MEDVTEMGYDDDAINDVYDKTDGYCYYCGTKLLPWRPVS